MVRARSGKTVLRTRKRLRRLTKGFVMSRHNLYRQALVTLIRGRVYAFRDRRAKKRDFRKLFIIRVTAAAEMRGLKYSTFIHGLRLANIKIDRKMLSELAIHDPETFDAITARVRAEVDKHNASLRARQTAKSA